MFGKSLVFLIFKANTLNYDTMGSMGKLVGL